ncbi:uncharacterized protein LOC108167175 [Poecilia reticulata]|uniref:uncharacterized protein LOC108167175 n=1 Tax=Poecilia reticulata TaxID=8081 RepID=UPI0007EA7FA4|nr:PREDICTED: uncharacterized protein LOC108167175 [Poecilia reticulata]
MLLSVLLLLLLVSDSQSTHFRGTMVTYYPMETNSDGSISTCTLSFRATSRSNEGWYAVQMVMEDFPRQSISLTHTNGSKEVKTTNTPISMIPIQFAFLVDGNALSCTDGVYLPKFVFPTPEHGARFYSPVNQTLEIKIRAEANQSRIDGVLYSGPYNVVKGSSGSGNFTLKWTPSASEGGQSHPICFIVQASSSYGSEAEDLDYAATERQE